MNTEFNYIKHYQKDAEEFDYFQSRPAGTIHDERRVREMIISRLPRQVKNVLDVGSGSAWVAQKLIPQGLNITSLDISKLNIEKAIKINSHSRHTGIVGDSFNLPFLDNSFDCVISSEVIEHITDPKIFVGELFRVVKTGGTLIITTPYKEELQYYLCIHCNKMTPLHSHIHSFDELKLAGLLNSDDKRSFHFKTFGNKVLLHLRTHILLKFFPFVIWELVDGIFNLLIRKPAHIIVEYKK